MKGSDALVIGACVIGGYLLLKPQEGGGSIMAEFLGAGEGAGLDLGGLFGGIGDMMSSIGGGLGEIFAGLGGGLGGGEGEGGGESGGQNIIDSVNDAVNSALGSLGVGGGGALGAITGGGEGGGGGTGWFSPVETSGNIFVDLANSLMGVAKAGVTGIGIYAGYKVGMPLAQAAGRALTPAVSNIAGTIGNWTSTGVKAAGSAARTGLGALGGYLTTPIGSLGAAGWAGAVPLAAAAGYGGWKLGEVFNKTAAGEKLQEWSGNLGASVARGDNPIQRWLFPHAGISQKTIDTLKSGHFKFWSGGYTYEDVKKMTTSQIAEITRNISKRKQVANQALKNISTLQKLGFLPGFTIKT
jgi:hypothetical protein